MSLHKVDSTTGDTSLIAGSMGYADNPIGTILAYGGTTAPTGWFLCQGQELTKTEYADLYAVIGDSFGTASANTKFKLPDLREATTKGVGLNGKSSVHYDEDGVALGEFIEDRVQDHLHRTKLYNQNFQVGSENVAPVTENGGSGVGTVGDIVVGRHGATTEVKSVGVNYIIKAKMIAVPADFMSAVEEVVGSWTVLKRASDVLETDMTGYKEALVYATNSYGTSTSNWHIVFDAYDSQVQFNGVQNGDGVIWNPVTKKLNVSSANSNCTVIAR